MDYSNAGAGGSAPDCTAPDRKGWRSRLTVVGDDHTERRRVKPAVAATYYDVVKSIKRWNASKLPLSWESSEGTGVGERKSLGL